MAYGRSRASSVLDGFTLNPLPYPVLLILSLIFIFLGVSCSLVIINGKFILVLLCFITGGKAGANSPRLFRRELSMGCGCFDPGVADNGAISIQLSG
ncbi:hypothetical protein D0Y65_033159 [Glycine soja]|uniref:Transmembrane protein n=1 Tax=Glycine soja TaxID=3848 RepID=A0A445HJP7_GLYSO|nr:hypothetical protein D0Y65_033159 [Glycine soja]